MQDIKPLLVFAAVLEHGSMQGAARALGMTPSAVSQHITRLEKQHRVRLLYRSTRRLAPTEAGLLLGSQCARLRQTLLDTQAALENLQTEAMGELHLALTSINAALPQLHRTLQRLREEYPGIEPVLHFDDRLADLQQGGIDIAIRGGDRALDAPDLVARHLVTWRWQICAAPNYLARHAPIERPAQLHEHAWIYCLPVHTVLQRRAESHVLDVGHGIRCSQMAAVPPLVLAGLGLSMQLSGDIAVPVAQGRLAVVLPDWLLPTISLYAVTPHRVQSAKVAVALRILQESFAESG